MKAYRLKDINPCHYNCGHYPEWEVEEIDAPPEVLPAPVHYLLIGGEGRWANRREELMAPNVRRRDRLFAAREEAQAEADRGNERSQAMWRDFLDG